MRRVLIVCLLFLSGVVSAWALELPPLRGELSGRLRLADLTGSPPITWHTAMMSSGDEANQIVVAAESSGLALQLQLVLPHDGGEGRWRVVEGEVDVNAWWKSVASYFDVQDLPTDLELSGILKLSGEGILDGNELSGSIKASLKSATANSAEQDWEIPGFDIEVRVNLAASKPSISSIGLRAPEARVAGVDLADLIVDATGVEGDRLVVNRAQVNLWEGRAGLREFELDLENPSINTTALIDGLSLEELAGLVPEALSDAQGRLSGSSSLKWSPAAGLEIGTGALTVTPDSPATLRLASAPGFLTQHLSEKIMWVPAMLGPVARWLALDNPAYETLRRIELGEMPLSVEKLGIALYPDGPNGEKSAVVEVAARPAEGNIVERVSFNINVSGPLKEVLLLGSDDRVRLETK